MLNWEVYNSIYPKYTINSLNATLFFNLISNENLYKYFLAIQYVVEFLFK